MHKVFWAKYDAHNEKTESWNNYLSKLDCLVDDPTKADIIVCAGGDGTLLKAVKEYIDYEIPIYGIHAGTIGFLMNHISQESFYEDVIKFGRYKRKKLGTIAVTVDGVNHGYAFNDVCIGGNMGTWAEFDVENKVLPSKFWGGGVIFSTAQGSTGVSKNNKGVVIPIGSDQWVITGDKTDVHLNTVIKPRPTEIQVSSRQRIDVWIDGNNKVVEGVKSVYLGRGKKVGICFSDFEGFVQKRYQH